MADGTIASGADSARTIEITYSDATMIAGILGMQASTLNYTIHLFRDSGDEELERMANTIESLNGIVRTTAALIRALLKNTHASDTFVLEYDV